MNYTKTKFKELEKKYGQYGSWGIWDKSNIEITSVIEENLDILFNCNTVFIGMNKSGETSGSWSNFHGGVDAKNTTLRNCCRLAGLINDTKYRGAYLTDLLKKDETKELINSNYEEIYQKVNSNPTIIELNVELMKKELNDIGVNKDTTIALLGIGKKRSFVKLFTTYFLPSIPVKSLNVKVCWNHGYQGSTEKWKINNCDVLDILLEEVKIEDYKFKN